MAAKALKNPLILQITVCNKLNIFKSDNSLDFFDITAVID